VATLAGQVHMRLAAPTGFSDLSNIDTCDFLVTPVHDSSPTSGTVRVLYQTENICPIAKPIELCPLGGTKNSTTQPTRRGGVS